MSLLSRHQIPRTDLFARQIGREEKFFGASPRCFARTQPQDLIHSWIGVNDPVALVDYPDPIARFFDQVSMPLLAAARFVQRRGRSRAENTDEHARRREKKRRDQ